MLELNDCHRFELPVIAAWTTGPKPFCTDCAERICTPYFLRLALGARVNVLCEQLARIVSLGSGELERRVGVRAEREKFLTTSVLVFQSPPSSTFGRDLKIQTTTVERLKRLLTRLK